MTEVYLRSTPEADADIEAAFNWYEERREGLGLSFLAELQGCYARISAGPLKYQALEAGIRRALFRRFPYSAYFHVQEEEALILAVLHAGRDPEEWQKRIRK